MKKMKMFLMFFTCVMLMGCSQPNSTDTESDSAKDEESVELKTGLHRAELNSKESFYLMAFGNNSAVAYDAKWKDESIDTLAWFIYQYEDNHWKNIESNEISLEGEEAWIAMNPELDSFKISVRSGSSTDSQEIDELLAQWNNGFAADTETVESADIEANKEFAVAAYRRYDLEGDAGKDLSLHDFEHPEEVQTDENDEYYILTFMFK